jgi:nitroreductase
VEFFEVIDCRHSVRTYRPDAVPDELIIQCLEAARMAPSWRNGQCWRFLIVRDATIISQLAAQRIYGYPINHWLRSAPVVVVACAEPGESGLLGDPPQEIGKAILAQVPNTVDLYWVDFTAYDIWRGADSATR